MDHHTTPPWNAEFFDEEWLIFHKPSMRLIAIMGMVMVPSGPNAAFIVRAVNAHEGLVEALEEIQCGERHKAARKLGIHQDWPCCIAREALAKAKETD